MEEYKNLKVFNDLKELSEWYMLVIQDYYSTRPSFAELCNTVNNYFMANTLNTVIAKLNTINNGIIPRLMLTELLNYLYIYNTSVIYDDEYFEDQDGLSVSEKMAIISAKHELIVMGFIARVWDDSINNYNIYLSPEGSRYLISDKYVFYPGVNGPLTIPEK